MTFMDRISRMVTGVPDKDRVANLLGPVYSLCVQRARLLQRHAEQSPNDTSTALLRELHFSEETMAKRIGAALIAAGGRLPTDHAVPQPPAQENHWSRLVQDLELHRHAAREMQESSFHVAEDFPELARLLLELSDETRRQCEHLRTLIARADPQALD
jgi:hypothetical protein